MNATDGVAVVETMDELADQNNIRPRCCCGRPECAFLEHNNTALGGLEKDLETAARLGKALLSRHESYINESQVEHTRLSSYIADLEAERTSLQSANEKIVAENKELLIQVETLNTNLATDDGEIKRLEDLLLDCELEVRRLNGLVRRAEELDARLMEMETERIALSHQVDEGQENVRNTMARWRESEKHVRVLEGNLERIEREARLDRERHEEIIARLDKERVLEKELSSAEGRLKGGAAIQSMKTNGTGSKNVVSHFVKDILQDNANLQAGIAELRDLLQTSNDEVQSLRDQIMLHQPMDEQDCQGTMQRPPSLEEQMGQSQASPKQVQQEVHVHHHYHAKLSKKDKPTPVRRSSRRRAVVPTYGYISDQSTPSTPLSGPQRYTTSPGPMNLYHPQPSRNRWSVQSAATNSTFLSSVPSSPRSYFDRGSSMFDRIERGEESSRPTSPESISDSVITSQRSAPKKVEYTLENFEEEVVEDIDNMSPLAEEDELRPDMLQLDDSARQITLPEQDMIPSSSLTLPSITGQMHESAGPEAPKPRPPDNRVWPEEAEPLTKPCGLVNVPGALPQIPEIRPSLARCGSHESLVSISGMDIHIAQRPSPASTLQLLRGNSAYFAQMPSQTRKFSASQPLASVTEYTVLSSTGSDGSPTSPLSSHRRPTGIEALSGIAVPPPRNPRGSSPSNGGLSRLVGGWVRSKWGMAPTKSVADLRSVSASQSSISTATRTTLDSDNASTKNTISSLDETTSIAHQAQSSIRPKPLHVQTAPSAMGQVGSALVMAPNGHVRVPKHDTIGPSGNSHGSDSDMSGLFAGRTPGINQPGFIPGFRAAAMGKRTPSEVQTSVIDEEGLRDCLAE